MSVIDTELLAGSVIRSRVRLARNIEGYPFRIENQEQAKEIIKKVNRALIKCGTFNLYYGANLTELKLEALKEEDLDFLAESAYADACRPGNPKETCVEDIKALFRKLM